MKYNEVVEKKLRLLEKKLDEIESWNIQSIEQLNKSSLLSNFDIAHNKLDCFRNFIGEVRKSGRGRRGRRTAVQGRQGRQGI